MAVFAGVWFFKSVFDISLFKLLQCFFRIRQFYVFIYFRLSTELKQVLFLLLGQKYVKVDNNISASSLLIFLIMHNCNVKYMRLFKSYPSTSALLGFFRSSLSHFLLLLQSMHLSVLLSDNPLNDHYRVNFPEVKQHSSNLSFHLVCVRPRFNILLMFSATRVPTPERVLRPASNRPTLKQQLQTE